MYSTMSSVLLKETLWTKFELGNHSLLSFLHICDFICITNEGLENW